MSRLTAFARFWWDFVIGDDWTAAAAVAVLIAALDVLAHHSVNAWWLLPPAVVGALYVSLRRMARR